MAAGRKYRGASTKRFDSWGGHSIELGPLPVYVLTAGAVLPIPDKTEAEREAIWRSIYELHEQLITASTSSIRRHTAIEGATHYIHRTHPGIVLGAARELLARIEAEKR